MAAAASDKKSANKITTLAFRKLREAHADEWESLKEAAAAELGVEYKRRKTAEEKARDTVAALLKDNPAVRAELIEEISKQIAEEKNVAVATSGE